MSFLPPPHSQPTSGSPAPRRVPPPPVAGDAANIELDPAPLSRRLGALVLDLAFAAAALAGLGALLGNMSNSMFNSLGTAMNPDYTKDPMEDLGGFLVIAVIFGLVWFVWLLAAWSEGTTPAKQLLGLRVVDSRTGYVIGFRRMFNREFLAKLMLGLFWGVSIAVGLLMILLTKKRTAVWDLMAGTVVVRGEPRRRALSRRELKRL